jgi:hypothetical protein
VTYGVGYWGAPFFMRVHGESTATVGTVLGLTAITAGWFGVTAGGVVSDWLKVRTPYARVYCGIFSALAAIPPALILISTEHVKVA